jgi:beta-1,2-mannobiose phosphorylase / 1,2-beta-oligomannan phosphorylase
VPQTTSTARRTAENPILTPAMVRPSLPELEVVGVFNPAVTRHDGDVVALLRVAESLREVPPGEVVATTFNDGRLEVHSWRHDDKDVDVSDPRVIVAEGRTWLTSISHLRVARSRGEDGIHFDVEPTPALFPANAYEEFGIEDPRITLIDRTYWINYTAVSQLGIATALASTRDFRTFERHGIIFPPPNRDVTIFPERIDGQYVALHRPMPTGIGEQAIWIASSTDLKAWGDHRFVAGARDGRWDDAKIGGGAVPFRVRAGDADGWLAIYHGVTKSPTTYSLGALLLDARDPSRVIARSRDPILKPEATYERQGFFGGVVFTCGALVDGDRVRVYYGAADGVTAVADLSLQQMLSGLGDPNHAPRVVETFEP